VLGREEVRSEWWRWGTQPAKGKTFPRNREQL